MEKQTSISIKVGLFMIIGLVCLVLGIYFIGQKKSLFSSNIKVSALFRDIGGLQKGNNVRFGGIDVGTVREIEAINDSMIKVVMSIDKKVAGKIYKNSPVMIGTDGLMGNRLMKIKAGAGSGTLIKDGDIVMGLESIEPDELIRVAQKSNKNLESITSKMSVITDEILSGKGAVSKLLTDSVFASQFDRITTELISASQNLSSSGQKLNSMVTDVRNGRGPLGKVISDTTLENQLSNSISSIEAMSKDLSESSKKINTPGNLFSTIFSDTASKARIDSSLKNIEAGTHSFKENMEALKHNFLFRRYFRKKAEKEKEQKGVKK